MHTTLLFTLLGAIATGAHAARNPAVSMLTVYDQANWAGIQVGWPMDDLNKCKNLQDHNMADQVSSLTVAPNVACILYRDSDCTGVQSAFNPGSDVQWVGLNDNDLFSSFICSRTG